MIHTPAPAPARGFDTAEYQARTENLQHKMAAENFTATLLTTEADIRYFTGFFTQFWQSPTRPWFVVIPLTGKPIAVIPEIGVEAMQSIGWVDDIRSWSSPHASDDGVSLLAGVLIDLLQGGAPDAQKIGLQMGRETYLRMPLADFENLCDRLKHGCPSYHFADISLSIKELRVVKSAAEIAKIRYIAQTVSGVFNNLPSFVTRGMRDDEIFKAFKIECLKAGVDDVAYLVGAAGKGGYGDIISPPKGRPLQEQDVLILDTGCLYDGYYCDFDRNYAVGSVDEAAKAAYETVWQATEAGFEAAKPGNRCKDLFHAMHDVMKKGGAMGDNVGRYGHGLGMQLTEHPSHTAWDDTILRPGMVLTLEPGMVFAKGRLMVHEENIVVTDTGSEYLSIRAAPTMPYID